MATIEIVPFGEEWLDDAAMLLAARHREQRAQEPALPRRFEEPGTARNAVLAAWREPGARGVAAARSGQLVGFLLGAPQIDATWGRSAWVRLGGHAIAPGEDADLYRDLYAALSPHWVAMGCFAHYSLTPATDRPALDAWFALSFGQQQVYAIRELGPAEPPVALLDADIEIRRATPDDLEALLEVADIVGKHQAGSPVYGAFLPEMPAGWRADYAALLADTAAAIWVAVRGGEVLGFALFLPDEPNDQALYVPERCCELVLAGTRAEERGRGIGQALAARGLAEMCVAGYQYCIADWRTTNLLASRFWPRQGFRPVAYRLHRAVDERVAWAY
jgi:ribosomal protein S18 acetylase RimI-like enzyme